MKLLAGDVGGTKTRLALFECAAGHFNKLSQTEVRSANATSFSDLVRDFLSTLNVRPDAACFGIPGPVNQGRVKVTNLPWELDERVLSTELQIRHVRLVNDLVSHTSAIPILGPQDLEVVHPGAPEHGEHRSIVVAPGTGLGVAFLAKVWGRYLAFPSENGHASFSPTSDQEIRFLQFLKRTYPISVSWERVLCGPGLINTYHFMAEEHPELASPEVTERIKAKGSASPITELGLNDNDPLCGKTLDFFLQVLGSHCADLVLTFLGTSGVYLGGGIPPKILPRTKNGSFMKGFLGKQRLVDVIEKSPVVVIKDDHIALLGAAVLAHETLVGS